MLDLIALLFGVIPAAFRSRRDVVLENQLLRHQLLAAKPNPARRREDLPSTTTR